MFLTTQYLEEADELADEIAIVEGGRILAQGTPEDLRKEFGSTRIEIRFADSAARTHARAELGALAAIEVGDWLHIEVAKPGDAPGVVAGISAAVNPDEISVHTSSLEDIFVDLTGTGVELDAEISPIPPVVAAAAEASAS